MGDTKIKVTLGSDGYKTEININEHKITSDHINTPPNPDETLLGATPTEILLGSLGACTAMTLKMYAERKNWDIGVIEVNLSYKQKASNQNPETQITREVIFYNELNDEQKSRLMEIAKACPVHKILTNQVLIQDILS